MVGRRQQITAAGWRDLTRTAREFFGIKSLRDGQRAVIETVLSGRSALGIMPTGAGKSLCYQLPALYFPKATVVVSPLLSLMHDQTTKLEEAGVEATKIDSTLTQTEERQAVSAVKKGHSELIYVTPERLETPEFLEVLRKGGVSLLVVDEAHCISQWGHDFRSAYLSIRRAAAALGSPPVLALTATATPEVEKDILEQLGIPDAKVVRTGIDRDNLTFDVYRTVNEEAKLDRLLQILFESRGNGLVYVNTVQLANELHARLLGAGIVAGKYHGRMTARERESAQGDFMENRFHVMVATKAFGLGIDKPDVRFVVHYTFPDSVETYYQEAGRAGRDGKPARAVLLYRLEDKRVHSFFLGGKYPTRADAAHLYRTLLELAPTPTTELKPDAIVKASGLPPTKARVLLAYLEKEGIVRRKKGIRVARTFGTAEAFEGFLSHYDHRLAADKKKIDTMMKYGQTTACRARFFREYFGEPSGDACDRCDNCRNGENRSVELAASRGEATRERGEEATRKLPRRGYRDISTSCKAPKAAAVKSAR